MKYASTKDRYDFWYNICVKLHNTNKRIPLKHILLGLAIERKRYYRSRLVSSKKEFFDVL